MSPGLTRCCGLLALGMLLALGWAVVRRPPTPCPPAPARPGVLRQVRTVHWEGGRHRWSMRADRVLRASRREAELEGVTLLLRHPEGEVRVRADRARWEEERVLLEGNVRGRMGEVRFRTELLEWFPERQLAQTDAPVRIERDGVSSWGRGMRLDLARRRMWLLRRVRTVVR